MKASKTGLQHNLLYKTWTAADDDDDDDDEEEEEG
jgi:hypothetical protein